MAGDELEVVRLKTSFYQDGFYKLLIALTTILIAIIFLIGLSVYIYISKPEPVYFSTDDEWRILPPVPLDKEFLSDADLVQWISEVLPIAFTFDFINYTKQLQNVSQYFTPTGWQKFLDQINEHANYNEVVHSKMFINSYPAGAPGIINRGLAPEGRWVWTITMPINMNLITGARTNIQPLTIRALIVRVPTLNNIYGVGIEDIVVTKGSASQIFSNKGA